MCPTIVCKAEPVSDGLRYIAEETSKGSVEGTALFLLAAYCEMSKERDKLREEPLSKMDPGFDDLKNSQAVQMAKDTKFRRFAVRKNMLWRESQQCGWITSC